MIYRSVFLFAACLASFIPAGEVQAGADLTKSSVESIEPADTAFQKGTFDLQVMSGVLFSQQRTTYDRPNVDYDLGAIRGGVMLDGAYGPAVLRGNDEFILEAAGGSIFVGPGSGFGGLCLLYRRNFLFPAVQSRLVPYFEGGGGGIYCDAFHNRIQRVLGSPFEFDLQAGLGLRFRFSRVWSLDAEANFRHFSNADLATRNTGVNAIGALIGVTRSF